MALNVEGFNSIFFLSHMSAIFCVFRTEIFVHQRVFLKTCTCMFYEHLAQYDTSVDWH